MPIPDSSLNALLDISKEINSIRDLTSLMETILDIAIRFLDAERGYVLLQQENLEKLTPVVFISAADTITRPSTCPVLLTITFAVPDAPAVI